MRLLVTGGCGFIGSNFIRYVLEHYQPEMITNVDALTYAGSLESTSDFLPEFGDRYEFIRSDIADFAAIDEAFPLSDINEERLRRVGGQSRRAALLEEMAEIRRRWSAMPVVDDRTPDEILAYDEHGLPR